MGGSRLVRVSACNVEVGDLVYDNYERVFNTVVETREVYIKETDIDGEEVLDLEDEIREVSYKEYVEDECKEGFSYFATKAINFVKHIAIGDPRERVLYRIESYNKMHGNDRYIRAVKLIYKNGSSEIISWYDTVPIKQDLDNIPVD